MSPYNIINLETWKRRDIFNAYQQFSNSTYCITFSRNFKNLYDYAKKTKYSFFRLSLYAFLKAINQVPQMRQRILGSGEVAEFEYISAFAPIMQENDQFIMCCIDYADDFKTFNNNATIAIEKIKTDPLLPTEFERKDLAVLSCVPWYSFTSISQAHVSFNNTLPVLGWGKMEPNGNITFSMQLNHSFIDGFHLKGFIESLEVMLANPETL